MTRIRATCPSCGEVDLRPDDVVLTVVRADDGEISDDSSYRFSCPTCTVLVRKPADERIAELLATGGVPIEESLDEGSAGLADDRPPHPEAPQAGPPLTYDDLLDLHLRLEDRDWFDELLSTTS